MQKGELLISLRGELYCKAQSSQIVPELISYEVLVSLGIQEWRTYKSRVLGISRLTAVFLQLLE